VELTGVNKMLFRAENTHREKGKTQMGGFEMAGKKKNFVKSKRGRACGKKGVQGFKESSIKE